MQYPSAERFSGGWWHSRKTIIGAALQVRVMVGGFMFYAKRIKMKTGSRNADCLTEIDSIYLTGCKQPGYYKKEILHDYLKDHPGSIKVDAYPTYPSLIPAVSVNYEKYVKSTPNGYGRDNLLSLPRD